VIEFSRTWKEAKSAFQQWPAKCDIQPYLQQAVVLCDKMP